MSHNPSNDRLVKNEELIRNQNRHASKSIKKYFHKDKHAINSPIAFICECSRLDCNDHINTSIECYELLHKRDDHFTIVRGHNVPKIEKIVAQQDDFDVVEKFALSS